MSRERPRAWLALSPFEDKCEAVSLWDASRGAGGEEIFRSRPLFLRNGISNWIQVRYRMPSVFRRILYYVHSDSLFRHRLSALFLKFYLKFWQIYFDGDTIYQFTIEQLLSMFFKTTIDRLFEKLTYNLPEYLYTSTITFFCLRDRDKFNCRNKFTILNNLINYKSINKSRAKKI